MDYLDFRISSTADCKYIFCQVILMDSCFSSLILLSKYRSSQFISGDGMSFSGSFWMTVNNKSSALLWKFWKNSFNRLRSLSSISIVINSNLLSVYIYMIPSKRKIYNIQDKNPSNYFFKIREICLSFLKENPKKTTKNSKKI